MDCCQGPAEYFRIPGALAFSAPVNFLSAPPVLSLLLGREGIYLRRYERKGCLGGALGAGAPPGALRVGNSAAKKQATARPCMLFDRTYNEIFLSSKLPNGRGLSHVIL